MQGHFDIFLQDAQGLTDDDFIQARQEGRLNSLLKELPVDREVHCHNMVMHQFPVCVYRQCFTGFPNGSYPQDKTIRSALHNINVSYDPSEPVFSDWMSGYWGFHDVSYSVNTSSASKRFVTHDIENVQGADPMGREAVFTRHRFLYLPSQIVSSEIRSVTVFWSEYVGDNTTHKGMIARVRMKDSGGQPVTLDKSSSQTLLIQYTLSLVSL